MRSRSQDLPEPDEADQAAHDRLGRQLNVLVSEPLLQALRAGAVTRGVSMAEVVRQALEALLGPPDKASAATGSDAANVGSALAAERPPVAAKLDAQAYQQLVRVGGNLNQALRAINGGRGDPRDWETVVEAARAVIALKRQVASLPPASSAEEAAGITLRREAVSAGSAVPARPASVPRDDGFSTVL